MTGGNKGLWWVDLIATAEGSKRSYWVGDSSRQPGVTSVEGIVDSVSVG